MPLREIGERCVQKKRADRSPPLLGNVRRRLLQTESPKRGGIDQTGGL